MHPYVKGELALGSIADRNDLLRFLNSLAALRPAKDEQVFSLIESKRLWARGIGWVDASLLASCLGSQCRLMTRDKRLDSLALELGVSAGT